MFPVSACTAFGMANQHILSKYRGTAVRFCRMNCENIAKKLLYRTPSQENSSKLKGSLGVLLYPLSCILVMFGAIFQEHLCDFRHQRVIRVTVGQQRRYRK